MVTMEQMFAGQVNENHNPFAEREVSGAHEWKGGGDKLKLEVNLLTLNVNQPSVHFSIKSGFVVDMKIQTENAGEFRLLVNGFENEGFVESRISRTTTGIGGDDILFVKMFGDDELTIEWLDPHKFTLDLRRDEGIESGGYEIEENLSRTADVFLKMQNVLKYTEVASDVEGETVATTDPTYDDVTLEIDDTYHPTTDPALDTTDPDDRDEWSAGWGIYVMLIMGATLVWVVMRK